MKNVQVRSKYRTICVWLSSFSLHQSLFQSFFFSNENAIDSMVQIDVDRRLTNVHAWMNKLVLDFWLVTTSERTKYDRWMTSYLKFKSPLRLAIFDIRRVEKLFIILPFQNTEEWTIAIPKWPYSISLLNVYKLNDSWPLQKPFRIESLLYSFFFRMFDLDLSLFFRFVVAMCARVWFHHVHVSFNCTLKSMEWWREARWLNFA